MCITCYIHLLRMQSSRINFYEGFYIPLLVQPCKKASIYVEQYNQFGGVYISRLPYELMENYTYLYLYMHSWRRLNVSSVIGTNGGLYVSRIRTYKGVQYTCLQKPLCMSSRIRTHGRVQYMNSWRRLYIWSNIGTCVGLYLFRLVYELRRRLYFSYSRGISAYFVSYTQLWRPLCTYRAPLHIISYKHLQGGSINYIQYRHLWRPGYTRILYLIRSY